MKRFKQKTIQNSISQNENKTTAQHKIKTQKMKQDKK